jgi:hypothetical protein
MDRYIDPRAVAAGSTVLRKVQLSYAPNGDPTGVSSTQFWTLNMPPSRTANVAYFTFGDIAMKADNSILYGTSGSTTTTQRFWSINLASLTGPSVTLTEIVSASYPQLYQLGTSWLMKIYSYSHIHVCYFLHCTTLNSV